jgi:Kef-type K+ transport system membrane component KefB
MEEVSNLFLPLFFMTTGLSLNIGSLGGEAFGILALVCAIARPWARWDPHMRAVGGLVCG